MLLILLVWGVLFFISNVTVMPRPIRVIRIPSDNSEKQQPSKSKEGEPSVLREPSGTTATTVPKPSTKKRPLPVASVAPVATSTAAPAPSRAAGSIFSARSSFSPLTTAVVVMAYNRRDYLEQTIRSLSSLEGIERTSVFISQDGDDGAVAAFAAGAGALFKNFGGHLRRPHELAQGKRVRPGGTGYLAAHFRSALGRLFDEKGFEFVVICEDDLVFSPDFVLLMERTSGILAGDPSVYCVSSWNDNGMQHLSLDPLKLYRTSYFPGLGWMMHRSLWAEIRDRWPGDHWDHWLRQSTVAKGRDCIAPVLARNHNIGVTGVNTHQGDYDRYLGNIAYNKDKVDWSKVDLSYLELKTYDAALRDLIARGSRADPAALAAAMGSPGVHVVPYLREVNYIQAANALGIFPAPRGHHRFAAVVKPNPDSWVVLVDARHSDFAPGPLRVLRQPTLEVVAAAQQTSCDATCAARSMRCDASQFDFINTCAELAKHFPCEQGCQLIVGDDIPNYVNDPTDYQHQMCLVTDASSTCQASHRSTKRICPCVK